MFMELQLQSERKKIIFFLWHKSSSDKNAVQVHSEKFKEETFCMIHLSQLTLQ